MARGRACHTHQCYYCYYMPPKHLTVARIGNSRGVRIPATTLTRYGIGDAVIMEEREDGILLRPVLSPQSKLSFEDTANAMAAASEDWSDLDWATADGMEHMTWDLPVRVSTPTKRVAESAPTYVGKSQGKRRTASSTTVDTPARGKPSKRPKP